MEEDVDKYFVEAEKDFKPELLETGNKLQKTIQENSEKNKNLEDDIARLELDLKEISWFGISTIFIQFVAFSLWLL